MLDVGSGPGFLAKHLDSEITKKIVMVDSSSEWTRMPEYPYAQRSDILVFARGNALSR